MPKDDFPGGITPALLLSAYRAGVFPMAENRGDERIFWVDPEARGILPLDGFHVSRSLRRALRRDDYGVRVDTAFHEVVEGCADRPETWINAPIFALYDELFRLGFAHSLEIWQDGALVGGVYGVALGAAFFGESMFSRRRDASKIALFYLVERLRRGGFTLLDTQFLTDHLASLGAIEITRADYRARLADALAHEADFFAQPSPPDPSESGISQRNTQTS